MRQLNVLATCLFIFFFSSFSVQEAHAQFNTSLTDKAYHQPWVLHHKVFEELSESQLIILNENSTLRLTRILIYLDTDAKYYESQVLEAINQLFGLPGFAENARQVSSNWGETLRRVDINLKIIYKELGIQNKANVIEANNATQTLIETLEKKSPFEKDVLNSLGRGIKKLMVNMANRWWIGSEGLSKLVTKLNETYPDSSN